MSSLSSILSLSSKKLVLENFHLLCYILSYTQSPLSCKLVNYLLQINKYYNTLINKLLLNESFSNIFLVKLELKDSKFIQKMLKLMLSSESIIHTNSNTNTSTSRERLASINLFNCFNIIQWNDDEYILNDNQSYQTYKAMLDNRSTCISSSNTSASNRMIHQIILTTKNDSIIKYTLENIHKTRVNHLCLANHKHFHELPSLNMKYEQQVVNNHLHTIIFDVDQKASYLSQFLTACKFNNLNNLKITNSTKKLIFTGTNMPLLTSLTIIKCENVNIDQHIQSNLLALEIDGLYTNYTIFDNMTNLTNLDINLEHDGIVPSNTLHSLINLTSLKIICRILPQDIFINMNKLKILILSRYNNSINGLFDNLISLTHLELPHYYYHYYHEEALPPLPNLTYILVPHCDKVKVPLFQNIHALKKLDVSVGDQEFGLIKEKNLFNLTNLDVNRSPYSLKYIDQISMLEDIAIHISLTSLSLKIMNIFTNKTSINPLSSLVNLTSLSFEYCRLTNVKLADIKNLQQLSVIGCKGKDKSILNLKYLVENCIKLKHLILDDPPPLNDSLFTLKQLQIIEFRWIQSNFRIDEALVHNTRLKSIIFGQYADYNKTFDNSLYALINLRHLYLPPRYSHPLPKLLPITNVYLDKKYPQEYLNNHPIDKIFYY